LFSSLPGEREEALRLRRVDRETAAEQVGQLFELVIAEPVAEVVADGIA
jgi:hypothetical protein